MPAASMEQTRKSKQEYSTLFQLKRKSRGGYWALFNFIPNKDEDAGLEYQQTHWDQPNTCLKPEPADWFTACLNIPDIPGKEEKRKKKKRGKEISLEKRISTFSTTHAHVFTSPCNLAKRNHLSNQDDLKEEEKNIFDSPSESFTGFHWFVLSRGNEYTKIYLPSQES